MLHNKYGMIFSWESCPKGKTVDTESQTSSCENNISSWSSKLVIIFHKSSLDLDGI